MKGIFIFVLSAFFSFFAFSQDFNSALPPQEYRSANEGLSEKEFRRGVLSFYRGSFNEAILQFEKALSYLPDNNLTLDWMGKAYYYSGLEGSALDCWEKIAKKGYGGALLQNKTEIIRERRVLLREDEKKAKYTESGNFYGVFNNELIFANPTSSLPNSDGSFWVLAYGTNELLHLNANGVVIDRKTGPINGFDHPMDIIRLKNGNLLISEASGDRLSLLNAKGKYLRYIGKKGRGNGEMISPQYLAEDSRENIFVSDYGNRRIDVFDKDGNGIFYFGGKKDDFPGFKGPTGIAIIDDTVFVADNVTGGIYEFDNAGNYRRILVEEKTFNKPESLKVWKPSASDEKYIVVSDKNKFFSVDTETGAVFENANVGNSPSRITSAVLDVNGNAIATDFQANEVYVMSKMQELVGGLFVQIEKIDAKKFPEISVEVKVENRYRKPIVGLKETNFYWTEDSRPVSNLKWTGAAQENDFCDITILIDRSASPETFAADGNVENVVRSIAKSMGKKGTLRIVSAGNIPVQEYSGKPQGAVNFSSSALKTPLSTSVPFDLALRLAANDLITAAKKRAIIIVGEGKVSDNAFEKYNLSETVAYLKNNAIPLLYVKSENNALDEELEYIVQNTFGSEYYIWRAEGLSSIVQDVINIPVALYSFSYTSALPTNFGEKYLPVEVEAYLLNRSGRDEAGYFAPLE